MPEKKRVKRRRPRRALPFLDPLELLLADVAAWSEAFGVVMPILERREKAKTAEVTRQVSELQSTANSVKKKRTRARMAALTRTANSARRIITTLRRLSGGQRLYARNAIIALVARLDEFIYNVLVQTYTRDPRLLAGSGQTITCAQLMEFNSIEEARSALMESEIERILRGSHLDQIDFLDKNFKIGIRDNFSRLPQFAELVQRRHVFAHAGGRVSARYLSECSKAKFSLAKELEIGSNLPVDREYFDRACDLVSELAVRVGQALYRRMFPTELHDADRELLAAIDEELVGEQWRRARMLADFAVGLPANLTSNASQRLSFALAQAIAVKGSGESDLARDLLEAQDLSHVHPRFSIMFAAVKGEHAEAAGLMRASPDALDEEEYRAEPAFRELRQTEEFADAFKRLFKKEYVPELPAAPDTTQEVSTDPEPATKASAERASRGSGTSSARGVRAVRKRRHGLQTKKKAT